MKRTNLSENYLKSKYGQVYFDLFEFSDTPKTYSDLVQRNNQIVQYLVGNPSKIKRTDNPTTINEFRNLVIMEDPGKEKEEEEELREERKLKRGGIISGPVVTGVMFELPFLDIVTIGNVPKISNVVDSSFFWEDKLKELNLMNNTDYRKLLNIDGVRRTVLTVMGISELLSDPVFAGKNLSATNLTHSLNVLTIYKGKAIEISMGPNSDNEWVLHMLAYVLPFLVNLKTVTLDDVSIKRFPDKFSQGPSSLHYLYIYNVKIKSLSKGFFANLKKLETLHIADTHIKKILPDTFVGLNSLQNLLLPHNMIKSIMEGAFNGLYNLYKLDLSMNNLKNLKDGSFIGLDTLEILNLSNNGIKNLSRNSLEGLENLRELNLSRNEITELGEGVFNTVPNLEKLNLRGNHIQSVNKDTLYFISSPGTKLKRVEMNNTVNKLLTKLLNNLRKETGERHLNIPGLYKY